MQLADQYAIAFRDVTQKNPAHAARYVKNLCAALKRRGHEKLLPRIVVACEHLELQQKRRQERGRETPASRRTRTLVELYKKLIA